MIAVVLEIVLGYLTDLSPLNILYVSLAVTLLAYLIGDLFILDKTNNTIATFADAGLALFTIWAFNWIMPDADISFTDALIASAVLAVGEWLYHKYVRKAVFPPVERA